jgi:hypothetical protein
MADVRVEKVHFPLLDIVPSSQDLVGAEVELVDRPQRELVLRRRPEPSGTSTSTSCWTARRRWGCSH